MIEISEGRHPVIDLLLEGGQFVANSTKLDVSHAYASLDNFMMEVNNYKLVM